MALNIIKENKNIHLEIQTKSEFTKISLFNHEGKYELLARRSSYDIFNFVRWEASTKEDIQVLKDFFKEIHESLNIPILKDDTKKGNYENT